MIIILNFLHPWIESQVRGGNSSNKVQTQQDGLVSKTSAKFSIVEQYY